MKKKIILSLVATLLILFTFSVTNSKIFSHDLDIVEKHNLDYSFDSSEPDLFYTYSSLRSDLQNDPGLDISNKLAGREIMLEDSLDLYNWSNDVSFKNSTLSYNKKQELLSQDYVLGNNIDYSERKSDRFFPIGYFDDASGEKLEFKGNFDGRGFEIKNLYLVVFNEYNYIDDLEQTKTPSSYFSMFNYNDGVIKNFGLIDPIIDLENELPTLQYFSYLVGENTKTVENVYVEDKRTAQVGGIRALASQVTEANIKSAAGIIHTNKGTFNNSYFAGVSVVNSDYQNLILEEPLVYSNTGTLTNIVYASGSVYHKADANVSNGVGEPNLTTTSILTDFEYYPTDGFPKLYKLNKVDGFYEITSALDLVHFTTLIKLKTLKDGTPFNEASYKLTDSINLNNVTKGAYKTPNVEFKGSIVGKVTQSNGKDKYPQINNLTITKGVAEGEEIYYGLFSTFSGTFENIAFYNVKIKPEENLINDINSNYFIGFLAGKLINAQVKNVFIEGQIDLQNSQVGAFSVGALAGEASGVIERVLFNNSSEIKIGSQNYQTRTMRSSFYLGGILGKTNDNNKLTLYNALNEANIYSLNATTTTNSNLNFYFGGVVGYVNNSAAIRHNIGLISNKGNLSAYNITNSRTTNYYLAGVIGYSSGNLYDQSEVYGKWTNSGELIYNTLATTNANIAGVLNSNHSTAIEFVQIYSDNDLILNNISYNVSGLINHLSTSNLTISQAISKGNYNLTVNKSIGLAIYLQSSTPVLNLNYVEVYNNLTYSGNPSSETFLSGVVYREKVNFLNVVYGGDMNITAGGSRVLWVSGFTNILTSGYYIKNSINEGSINIQYSSSGNLYVAGLVNRNLSGDLHNQDSNTRPKATTGIMNSINMANIETLSTSTGRTFIGGLVTLNGGADGGSIQDAVNTGNIIGRNSNSNPSNPGVGSDSQGGVITSYNSGVTVAGIAAMVVYGKSRIYDTSNKGDIIGIARRFVRSGGVLGSALPQEASSGQLSGLYNTGTSGVNAIGSSIISNGINYGDVQAITQTIGSYGNNTNTSQRIYYRRGTSGIGSGDILAGFSTSGTSYNTRTSTNIRPGVYSAAGGVIGYGLSKMYRMVNHGNIAATDVAGGVVGATSVVSTTTVFINTAINYGDIRAIRASDYTNVYNNKKATTANFYGVNDQFLYPNTRSDIRLLPETKRGFGGVFGRLQRGSGQTMSSSGGSFDFVVNMNPNIDLIGRLDQVYDFSSSSRFFIFVDAIYYSAKVNDTTQVVFTGYEYSRTGTSNATFEIRNYEYQYSTDDEGYPLYRVRMTGGNRYAPRRTQTQNITVFYKKVGNRDTDEDRRIVTSSPDYSNTSRYTNTAIPAGSWSDWMFDDGGPKPAQTNDISGSISWTGTRSGATFIGAYNVNEITENPLEATSTRKYVYNPYFEMRNDETILDDGEPITSYIYYAENDLLANQFKEPRPNGMYVLSSSSGSNYGAILPKNFNIGNLKKIKDNAPNFLDYENVDEDYLIDDLDSSYGDLFEAYESLYQTKYNDKSALLNEGQSIKAKDKNYNTEVFYESNDFTGNTITFVINRDLINPASSFTLDFEMLKAVIPEGALIASSTATQAELEAFRNANEGAIIATGAIAPELTFTANNRNQVVGQTITLGTFTSYSEAAIFDNAFKDVYSTEYTVRLQVVNTNVSNPTLNALRLDGGNYSTSNLNQRKNITSSIGMRFNDGANKLPNGYIIDEFIRVSYQVDGVDYEVSSEYYSVISTPKSTTQFTTDIYFSDQLRPGNYVVEYRFYESDTPKYVLLNNTRSVTYDFIEFVPYTSLNYDGTTADFEFGYDLENLHDAGMTRTVNTEGIPIYLADYYNYEVDFLQSFVKTDFFEFDNITVTEDKVDGYLEYTVNFREGSIVRATKKIKERALSPNYYKDGSSVPKEFDSSLGIDIADTTATREAENTIFTLDYKLAEEFYNNEDFLITFTYNGGTTETITSTSNLIYSAFDERLNIIMTKDALPGEYIVTVKYLRDNDEINAGRITISKEFGTSGYLNNIKFSRFVVGNEYPDLFVTNNNNTTIDTNYDMGIYYNGINYADADYDGEKYFRIEGTVAKIPLNYYMPVNITDYLPDGAMIKRKIYTSPTTFIWSDLVDSNNTTEEIQQALATDFTIDPKTGAFTEDKVYIEYMVVPETEKDKDINSQEGITYFISVTDITYTFLAIFNFWYDDGTTINKLDDEISFDQQLITLSMYNYQVSNNEDILEDSMPEEEILDIEFDNIDLINSRVHMFYYIDQETKDDYLYQIGNNLSGFYKIKLILPKGYKYKIYIENYDDEDNLLPLFDNYLEGEDGYFYYINTSSITRTRYFHVVVEETEETDEGWGLTDNKKTWD